MVEIFFSEHQFDFHDEETPLEACDVGAQEPVQKDEEAERGAYDGENGGDDQQNSAEISHRYFPQDWK
ncbi:hypothetical protein [Leucobacter sp. G161]|uniref:hypothetical protein n=1 Tax=Leucobacter sp. G161 TaxID=663704 RepID=UPI00073AFC17|nr:hypothetical protein [Leucobacter sp. G161]KUF08442.1 hypothetical protein AUL38_04620 [Leucobacter sp. G161]